MFTHTHHRLMKVCLLALFTTQTQVTGFVLPIMGANPSKFSRSHQEARYQQGIDTVDTKISITGDSLTSSNMPWKTSIQPGNKLTFMPYYTWTKSLLACLKNVQKHSNVKYSYMDNLHSSSENDTASTFSSAVSMRHKHKKARIFSESYESDEYRKIRMTYYDAGHDAQVFNSLWYPRPNFGKLPLLGIDLLQFRDKFLVVVDFQPLEKGTTIASVSEYWQKMPSILKGRMSKRFYDENQFFSDKMIFGRFDKNEAMSSSATLESIVDVNGELWNAFETYVLMHIDMTQRQHSYGKEKQLTGAEARKILDLHKQYDIYSAERDPAHAMLLKTFGKNFADGFVYDFLFDLSKTDQLSS